MNGILRFSNNSKLPIDVPVEVRKSSMALVKTGMTSDAMELAPGDYFVTARMPAGQELYGQITLEADTQATVELTPDPADESPRESQAATHYLLEKRQQSERQLFDKIAGAPRRAEIPKSVLFDWMSSKMNDRNSADLFESFGIELAAVYLRVFRGNPLNRETFVAAPQFERFEPFEAAENLVQFRIRGSGDSLFIVQLLQTGAAPQNLILPAFSDVGCTLVVKRESLGLYTLDANLENLTADLLLRYTHKGFQRQAELTSQAVNAEDLLFRKHADAIAAAVGAYALLRFGELERMHDWAENLRRMFPPLPDGAAIRGEQLAREGRHEEAADAFLDLTARGIPVFSEGLSYAIRRLRFYAKLIEGNKFGGDYKEKINRLLDKLQLFAAYTDFRQPITTFTGASPIAPDDKDYKDEANDGFDVIRYFK